MRGQRKARASYTQSSRAPSNGRPPPARNQLELSASQTSTPTAKAEIDKATVHSVRVGSSAKGTRNSMRPDITAKSTCPCDL